MKQIQHISLSIKARNLIKKWANNRNNIYKRIDWDSYFLQLAYDVAKRSHDSQTQHGSVIVSSTNEIISTGYNGVIRDINDKILPNTRPEKYAFMIHSEHNAILSCARQGKSTLGSKIYVTGEPCINCYQLIWQAGIQEVIFGQKSSHMQQNERQLILTEIFKYLVQFTTKVEPLKIRQINYSPTE